MATIWRNSSKILPAYGDMVIGGFDVEIGIWPVSLGHRVGVVWTPDRWRSVHWADAQWSGNANNNYGGCDEIWEATIGFQSDLPGKFWYALYVVDANGNWFWDNNNGWNYETKGLAWA